MAEAPALLAAVGARLLELAEEVPTRMTYSSNTDPNQVIPNAQGVGGWAGIACAPIGAEYPAATAMTASPSRARAVSSTTYAGKKWARGHSRR